MINFPYVPAWWRKGSKFTRMHKGFVPPDYISGYDTETFAGQIMTQQFSKTRYGKGERFDKIDWVNNHNVLDRFLSYYENLSGHIVNYCFNASFDMAILLREYIDRFLEDDFMVRHESPSGTVWELSVFCSKNWYAYFKCSNVFITFLDIRSYFTGSLDTVANTFGLKTKKLDRPEELGQKRFEKTDKKFVEYALTDARLCLEIGEIIIKMHEEFDIPLSTSSANFAEKVFRRQFIPKGHSIKFPPFSAQRLAEITYHGGKNGYYLDNPSLIHKCYEYDFNAAYGYAMYTIPSFLDGEYRRVDKYKSDKCGVYQVIGTLQPCKYGIFYDARFNYFRFPSKHRIKAFVTSYELEEALQTKEFKIDEISGWIWIPSTTENPLKEYSSYFWEKKNSTPKYDVRYIFYKLLLNSLYGKWIQRNPARKPKYTYYRGAFSLHAKQDVSGGLYNPFVATLITGYTRARLHHAEHYFSALESSTDSVKSRKYDAHAATVKQFGVMQLERLKCKKCETEPKTFTGLFVRNRLNLLMCSAGHVMKCALHGFWGKPEQLKQMFERREYLYTVERMPLIREGIKQVGKDLFMMQCEERSINISWDSLKEIR